MALENHELEQKPAMQLHNRLTHHRDQGIIKETKMTLNNNILQKASTTQHIFSYIRLQHETSTLKLLKVKTHRVQPIPPKSQNQT